MVVKRWCLFLSNVTANGAYKEPAIKSRVKNGYMVSVTLGYAMLGCDKNIVRYKSD